MKAGKKAARKARVASMLVDLYGIGTFEATARVEGIRGDRLYELERTLTRSLQRKRAADSEHVAYTNPDDTGYEPRNPDALLTGVGRVTGNTARAVKRGTTFTKTQLNKEQQ